MTRTITPWAAVLLLPLAVQAARQPQPAIELYELGIKQEMAKKYDEAIESFSRAIDLDPTFIEAYFSRASIHSSRDDMEKRDDAKAVADYTSILKLKPDHASARKNRALAYEGLQKFDEALQDYRDLIAGPIDLSRVAVEKEEWLSYVHYKYGELLRWHKKEPVKAIASFREALRLWPNLARDQSVHLCIAFAHADTKDYGKADEALIEGLRIDAEDPSLLCSRAMLLAACPDAKIRNGKLAVELATKGNEVFSYSNSEHLAALAAAYAETGDFVDAVRIQKLAISKLSGKRGERQRPQLEQRLKLYEAEKPYRLPAGP